MEFLMGVNEVFGHFLYSLYVTLREGKGGWFLHVTISCFFGQLSFYDGKRKEYYLFSIYKVSRTILKHVREI